MRISCKSNLQERIWGCLFVFGNMVIGEVRLHWNLFDMRQLIFLLCQHLFDDVVTFVTKKSSQSFLI